MSRRRPSAVEDLSYIALELRPLAVDASTLVFSPRNARQHDIEKDIPVLIGSLERFGQMKPIVARVGTREVIAGNGTLRATTELGRAMIAVSWFHGTDEEAEEYALLDNRTAELSTWNPAELSRQLTASRARNPDRSLTLGWTPSDMTSLISASWRPQQDRPPRATRERPGTDAALEPTLTITATRSQYDTIRRAFDQLREQEGDVSISEGRCLELLAAEFLS